MYYSYIIGIVYACTIAIIHTCIIAIILACIMAIVHACIIAIIHLFVNTPNTIENTIENTEHYGHELQRTELHWWYQFNQTCFLNGNNTCDTTIVHALSCSSMKFREAFAHIT